MSQKSWMNAEVFALKLGATRPPTRGGGERRKREREREEKERKREKKRKKEREKENAAIL